MIWLLLLGLFTYIIVQRVTTITRTPAWLLWLVAMTPAFIWSAWVIVYGESRRPPPPGLVLIPFVVCLLLYWFLIQWGRVSPSSNASPTTTAAQNSGQAGENPPETTEETTLRSITREEETTLQNCFPWSVYYLQGLEHRPQAIICRGQLRTRPDVAYQTVRENVEAKFGDRFLVVFQEGQNGKPFFALVVNPQAQAKSTQPVTRPGTALALLGATLMTTNLAGAAMVAKDPQAAWALAAQGRGMAYALALLAILGMHELGHYLMARRYKIRATLPYFIPVLPLPLFPFGTFGAFIQLRSSIPNRKALFDVGIAGPLAGLVVALPLLLWGLAHSSVVVAPDRNHLFNFTALNPNLFMLMALCSKLVLKGQLTATSAINLHPVAIAGYLGLLVTALNLMPVGQLDGGHIVHAMFGQRTGAAIGQAARFLLLVLSLVQPHLLFWAILLFFLPAYDEPALNDVSELDNRRDLLGLISLALLLLIILPAPRAITTWFNF